MALDPQRGMSLYLIWAYHMWTDAQPSLFPEHDKRGIQLQELIPAVTPSPTPGRFPRSYKPNITVNCVNKKTEKQLKSPEECRDYYYYYYYYYY